MDSFTYEYQPQYHTPNQSHERISQIRSVLQKCLQYIGQLFKICHMQHKQIKQTMNLLDLSQHIEKGLKKLATNVPKKMVLTQTYHKCMKDLQVINQGYQNALKEVRNYRCQINVMEKRLEQAQHRQQMLMEEKIKKSQPTNQFQSKLYHVKKQSESQLEKKKIIDTSFNKDDENFVAKLRKKSLPAIINTNSKKKLGTRNSYHHAFNSANQEQKTHRLIQHLIKKY